MVLSGYSPASSTTKTDRHDIADILLKVALKTPQKNQINQVTLDNLYYSGYAFDWLIQRRCNCLSIFLETCHWH